jgi:hypothetical protein
LELISMETFAESDALTLAEMASRFLLASLRMESLGFGDHFRQLWEYYLSYAEAGFRSDMINVGLCSLRPSRVRSDLVALGPEMLKPNATVSTAEEATDGHSAFKLKSRQPCGGF